MTYKAQYHKPSLEYNVKKELDKIDFSNLADKTMHKEPLPWGWYGYTFLGENFMAISDKLSSGFSYVTGSMPSINYEPGSKTQTHEGRHTDWEYETRVITDWVTDITLSGIKYLQKQYTYIKEILENTQPKPNYQFAH